MEIICKTIVVIIIIYWMMPTKKMEAVNNAVISLLQILPVSSIIKALKKDEKKDEFDDTSKEE